MSDDGRVAFSTLALREDAALGPLTTAAEWERWEPVGLRASQGLDSVLLRWVASHFRGLSIKRARIALSVEFGIDGIYTATLTVRDPRGHIFSTVVGADAPAGRSAPRGQEAGRQGRPVGGHARRGDDANLPDPPPI